jgi:hypothetical protein
MKKMLMIALALGLAVALAAPATATDWSASGYIYVLGAVHKTMPSGGPVPNPDPTSPPYFGDAWNDTWSWVRMGAGLDITARQSEDLYGVLGFRMHSSRWGEPDTAGDPTKMAAWYRAETTGTLSVLLNHAYIDFRVPPKLPIWMRVGVQPIFVRPWVFVMWDGPGISLRIPIDPIKLTITPAWYKKWEGADFEGDDNDVYTVDMNMPIGPVLIGSFFWYENYNDWSRANANMAVVDDSGNRNEADLWYIGVYSNGKLGPVSYMLDFVYGGGEIDGNPAAAVPVADRDIESWVIRGETSVNISKFTVGLGALYATGEDNSTVDSEQYIAPNQREGGLNGHAPLQDFLLLTDGFLGMIPARGNMAGYIGGPNPLGGVWYVRGFAQVMLTDWMRVGVNMGWIGDTTDDGNRIGNAQDAAGNLRDDDDIGFEIDVGANIQLYKNLQWGIGFGYLVAGDAMDMNTGVVGVNEAPQDPWVLCTALLYTF